MAEGTGVAPVRVLQPGYGLANRPITVLAAFQFRMAEDAGIQPAPV